MSFAVGNIAHFKTCSTTLVDIKRTRDEYVKRLRKQKLSLDFSSVEGGSLSK